MGKSRVGKMISYVTHLGITMIVPTLLMVVVGRFIVVKTGSNLAFIICIVLGILAGFRNCYILLKEEIDSDIKDIGRKNQEDSSTNGDRSRVENGYGDGKRGKSRAT